MNQNKITEQKMSNRLLRAIEELKKGEEIKRKKKKSIFCIKKEKRLNYYSGWHKDDEPVDKIKTEKQKKLFL